MSNLNPKGSNLILLFCVLFFLLPLGQGRAFAQKITKATQQKTFGGMGGVFMNYIIELKNNSIDTIKIDSVKTNADTTGLRFSSMKLKNGNYQIAFGFTLAPPSKCKTCADTFPKPSNMTKGATIYYWKGSKKAMMAVKKFKKLPDVMLP